MVDHWVIKLADKVVKEKGETVVIAAGITTSGPPHLGTVCEFLYPWALVKELRKRGIETYFIFVGDIMDAFDSIPASLKEFYEELKPHLGKPLAHVPDPYGCHGSYGEHFLNETAEIMGKFGVKPDEIVGSNRLYLEGFYDDYLVFFIENLDLVRRILEETSLRKLPVNWKDIVLPVCEKCGKIATTRVLGFNLAEGTIEYVCNKDVGYAKGCGYRGKISIKDHMWKLVWRLDWPSRQDFLGVDVEGAGVDHHTRGGSWDTAVAVHTQLFKKKPPIGFKYGFILLKGRKMSKSKGLGDLSYMLSLVPPEVLKYFLFKGNLEENKNFKDDSYFLLRLYEEFRNIGLLFEKNVEVRDPSLEKKIYAYMLASETDKAMLHVSFVDVLVIYQVYKDWNVVVEKLDHPEEVYKLKTYVENWVKLDIIPKEYRIKFNPQPVRKYVDVVREFAEKLSSKMSDVEIHNLVYEVAREHSVDPRELFKVLYKSILGQSYGPRLGRLIAAIGVTKVKETLLKLTET